MGRRLYCDQYLRVTERSYYIGVGRAYLDGLAVAAVSKMELDHSRLQNLQNSYYEIHRRIKELELRKSQ